MNLVDHVIWKQAKRIITILLIQSLNSQHHILSFQIKKYSSKKNQIFKKNNTIGMQSSKITPI